jgi:hypothetical protein
LRGPRLAAAAAALALLVPGLSACGAKPQVVDIAAIDLTPEKVVTASFTAQGQTADVHTADGVWSPGNGASVQAATMLSTIQDRLFPLNAYRILTGLNQSDPVFGFDGPNNSGADCGAACSLSVADKSGKSWKLTVGAPSFNKAGFYAKLDGDPRVFLITQQTVADIISEAIGKDFAFPESARYKQVDDALNMANADKAEDVLDPFVRQVLAAQQAEESVKAGQGSRDFLMRAATSTKSLAGAKEQHPIMGATGSDPQAGAGR